MERESVITTYTENERSMLRYLYDCVFFVVRKPVAVATAAQPAGPGSQNDSDEKQSETKT